MLRWAALLLFITLGVGCRNSDRRTDDDLSPSVNGGDSLTRANPDYPPDHPKRHWLKEPVGPTLAGRNAPTGGFASNPNDPAYDTENATKSIIAGYVVGVDGGKIPNAIIEVEEMNGKNNGAPLEVESLPTGSFMISNLVRGRTYQLSVRHTVNGVNMAGMTVVQVPNITVRLELFEGLVLPSKPAAPATPGKRQLPPKPASTPAPSVLPESGPLPAPGAINATLPTPQPLSPNDRSAPIPRRGPSSDTGWSPDAGVGTFDPTEPLPPPSRGRLDLPPRPNRPDLSTNGPEPGFRAPAVNIPSGRNQSRKAELPEPFSLVDTLGRERSFPTAQEGELQLLDFMTTTCIPCQRSLPFLTAIQAKYGARGVEVVGVVCDDEPLKTRMIFAEKYRKDHVLNYAIYTEPGRGPGLIMKRFGVKVYPTAVLLDSSGQVVWQGNPNKADDLNAAIENYLLQRGK